ncbi:hypothetical protein DM01DRAFT_1343896 [Hesseltinella vesiculosa]|uniref:BZIP domain-containing protein n=1 Tax=Hesseltinella vesiculosa TaxID=101127 RepID=A0A1X2GNC1_9FUNG|nr:hypothetical protein DM01DRAFT_1343896 [Hesseltinella vesiculosa]
MSTTINKVQVKDEPEDLLSSYLNMDCLMDPYEAMDDNTTATDSSDDSLSTTPRDDRSPLPSSAVAADLAMGDLASAPALYPFLWPPLPFLLDQQLRLAGDQTVSPCHTTTAALKPILPAPTLTQPAPTCFTPPPPLLPAPHHLKPHPPSARRRVTNAGDLSQKRQERLIKNRAAALLSRKRKREYLQSLEDERQVLLKENEALKAHADQLNDKLEAMQNGQGRPDSWSSLSSLHNNNALMLLLVAFVLLLLPLYQPDLFTPSSRQSSSSYASSSPPPTPNSPSCGFSLLESGPRDQLDLDKHNKTSAYSSFQHTVLSSSVSLLGKRKQHPL